MSDFHFIRPEWLFALIPLALLWWFKRSDQQQSDWQKWLPQHLSAALLSNQSHKQSLFAVNVLAISWLLMIIALAGPTWQKIEKPVFKSKLANVIVLDMSMSMRSTDINPDRLTRAKFKAIDLAKALGDAEVGLVAYAGDAFTISPLTQDARNIAALIPSLSPEIMPIPGSYPLLGMIEAQNLLTQAGYLSGNIYWITDGVESIDVQELINYASNSTYQINVLAIGSSSGAPIKMLDGSLLKDDNGNIVMPRLNLDDLSAIAKASGGVTQSVTASDSDVSTLAKLSELLVNQQLDEEQASSITGDDWLEFGPYLVMAALPLVLFLFKRGISLAIVLSTSLTLTLLPSAPSFAAPIANLAGNSSPQGTSLQPPAVEQTSSNNELSLLDKVFNTDDQLGRQAYKQKQFSKAAELFDDPKWKGAAAYKAADYPQALEYFRQGNDADAYYNQGNALAQMFEIEQAIEAYEQALQLKPDFIAAAENKKVLEDFLEKQQSNQQQSDQQQNNSNQQSPQNQQQGSEQQQNSQSENNDSENNGSESAQQQASDQQPSSEDKNAQQSQSDTAPEDSPSQSSEQQAAQQSESQSEQHSAAQQQQGESELDESKQQGLGQQQLSPEEIAEQEEAQRIKQLLRKVDDNPSVLLRNKMILESRRRQQERRRAMGATKSW